MKVLFSTIDRIIFLVANEILENENFYVKEGTLEKPTLIIPKVVADVAEVETATTEDIGKIYNEDGSITEPEKLNQYGVTDQLQEQILSDYRDQLAKEVGEINYDA